MPYFGVPIRNGLPIGLGTLTALAKAVAVVVPPVSSDPYFEYVSLLLNTTSTNGAQNNTFLDSSTNAFSVTRNGNTTQGTFSPFSQTGWSNYFDGTGDSLSLSGNSAFSIATSTTPFTIEGWVYISAAGGCLFSEQFTGGSNSVSIAVSLCDGVGVETTTGRFIGFGWFNGTAWTSAAISTTEVALNTWTHVACVFTGSTTKIYLNGVDSTKSSSPTPATTWGVTGVNGDSWFIGRRWSSTATEFLTGYISNLRFVNGTAVYTAAFTPPTAPLTNITNTSLLTCQSNRFIDNSSNAFAITRNGDVSVQAFSPFNPTAAWSASTNGGSGYFDGTGDYLIAPTNAAFDFGSGNFTVELWFYSNIANSNYQRIFGINAGGTSPTESVAFEIGSTGILMVAISGSTQYGATTATPLSANTWHHLALVRNGNTVTGYINGVSAGSSTLTGAVNFATGAFPQIGAWFATAYSRFINGYVADLRIVKGTAVYTSNFTPPTAPLTAITNTSLLLNFTNAGIYDSASGNDLETVGNAQVSTVQAKWGTTSMAFDGTGDWLVVPDRPTQRLGSGDFTVEMWLYKTGGLPPGGIIGKGTSTTGWELSWQTGNTLRFTFGSTSTTSVATINNNTWYHLALVRSGSATGNVKLYLDGTLIATSGTAVTDNLNQTNVMYVGADRTGANTFTGYIDDLRITNGYARYTANFTPPTAAFPLN